MGMDHSRGQIYESPDGGLTVYARAAGSDPQSRRLISATDAYYQRQHQQQQDQLWQDIRAAADSDAELANLLDRAKIYYLLKHG